MKFTFYKGKHRASPIYWLRWFPLLFFRKTIIREVRFTQDSKYDLPDTQDQDQADTNKIVGFCSLTGMHKNSVRAGVYYDKELGVFVFNWYVYKDGERSIGELTVASTGITVYLQITLLKGVVNFKIWEPFSRNNLCDINVERGKITFLSLLAGPYFGGNFPAPHNVVWFIGKVSKKFRR